MENNQICTTPRDELVGFCWNFLTASIFVSIMSLVFFVAMMLIALLGKVLQTKSTVSASEIIEWYFITAFVFGFACVYGEYFRRSLKTYGTITFSRKQRASSNANPTAVSEQLLRIIHTQDVTQCITSEVGETKCIEWEQKLDDPITKSRPFRKFRITIDPNPLSTESNIRLEDLAGKLAFNSAFEARRMAKLIFEKLPQ